MGLIPRGSLAFSGFGNAPMKFLSPSGVDLGQPPSAPVECGSGCDGVVALKGSGKIGVMGGNAPHFGTTSVGIFSTDFSSWVQGANGANGHPGRSIARDDAGGFYGLKNSSTNYVMRYDASGAQTNSWTLTPGAGWGVTQLGVNGAGTKAYVGAYDSFVGATVLGVYSFSLVGGGGSWALFASETGYRVSGQTGILCLSNGEVLIGWAKSGSAGYIKHYDAAGSLLHTYTLTGTNPNPVVLTYGLDDTTFWVGFYDGSPTTNGIRISELQVGTGTTLHTFAPQDGTFQFDSSFCVLRETGSVGPNIVPVPIVVGPPVPCTPQSEVSGGAKGQGGCNTGGLGWVPSYNGPFGTVPQHADPVEGELLTGKRRLDLWIELVHTVYPPTGLGPITQTKYSRALRELADDPSYYNGRKPEGLVSIGEVEHGLGNEQGAFEAANVDINYADHVDRLVRELLAVSSIDGDELRVYMASPAARAAGAAPRVLMRATVQQEQLQSQVSAILTAVDCLFADYGPFGPNRQFPELIPPGVFPSAPADSLQRALPWLYGEKSDEGAVDPKTNKRLSKGLCPLIYVGQKKISRTVQVPPASMPTYDPTIQKPKDAASLTTTGSTWNLGTYPFFAIAGIIGNKFSDPIFLDNTLRFPGRAGEAVGPTFNEKVIWNTFGGTVYDSFIVWMYDQSNWNPATNPYTNANARYQIVNPPNTNPTGPPPHLPTDPPATNYWQYELDWNSLSDGAAWPPASTGGTVVVDEDWDIYVAFGHASFRIISVYGSDLGSGNANATHDRIRLDPDARGDILVPGFAAWPFPTTYLDFTDTTDGTVWRMTVILARGPLSEDHKNGVVNLAVNAIGVEDVGDGTGLPLIDAHDCEQHWIENPILGGWRSGPWATNVPGFYPAWEDGTPKVRSSAFRRRQTFTIQHLPALGPTLAPRGLRCGWYVDAQKPMSAHVLDWNNGTETKLGFTGQGQITVEGLDETLDPSTWPRVVHSIDLFGPITQQFGQERETVVSGSCDWDGDAGKFRTKPMTFRSKPGKARNKDHDKPGDPIDSPILNINSQFEWVLKRRLTRLQFGMTIVQIRGTVDLLDYDVGTGIRLTTIEGTGPSGYVDRPFLIMRRRFSFETGIVTYTLWDVADLLLASSLPGGLAQRFIFNNSTGATLSNNPAIASVFSS